MNHRYCAGIVIRENKILLLKRSTTEDQPHKWCPINGSIEDGESPDRAVVREVNEEVGLDFKIIKILSPHFYNGEAAAVFLGETNGEIKIDPNEVEDCGWFTYDEALKLSFAYGYENLIEVVHDLQLI